MRREGQLRLRARVPYTFNAHQCSLVTWYHTTIVHGGNLKQINPNTNRRLASLCTYALSEPEDIVFIQINKRIIAFEKHSRPTVNLFNTGVSLDLKTIRPLSAAMQHLQPDPMAGPACFENYHWHGPQEQHHYFHPPPLPTDFYDGITFTEYHQIEAPSFPNNATDFCQYNGLENYDNSFLFYNDTSLLSATNNPVDGHGLINSWDDTESGDHGFFYSSFSAVPLNAPPQGYVSPPAPRLQNNEHPRGKARVAYYSSNFKTNRYSNYTPFPRDPFCVEELLPPTSSATTLDFWTKSLGPRTFTESIKQHFVCTSLYGKQSI